MPNRIRRCTENQLDLLQAISIETYRDTFIDSNSEEIMQNYLDSCLNKATIEAEFNQLGSVFYFIYHEDEVAGFIKLNEAIAQTDINDRQSLEIERLYIRKVFFRKGFGNLLMDFACDLAKNSNKKYVWLGVWENNTRALAFYQKTGFVKVGEHPFDMGGDIQTDFVLKKTL